MTDASRAGDTLRDAAESLRMPRSLFDEPFLLNLLEPVSDGVAIVGTAGDIVLVNAQIETLFGYTRDELLGRPFEMLLAERFRTKCDAPQVSASDAGRVADTRRGRDCYGLHRNGDEFPVEMRLSPITMPAGESLACWSLRDVSEGKRAQVFEATREQIRQAQKLDAVGQLAGGVAHNFNNLLTAILGYAELLMLRDDMDDLARHDLEEIKKAGKRAAMLARQLLAFSRKHTTTPQDVDLNRAVADLEPMIRNLIRENITLTCRLAPRPAVVRIDPSEIEQVLLNLILNARDALVSGGHIRIEIDNAPSWPSELGSSPHQPSADRVALRVIDDGTGIAPDVRAHLFEPFFTTKGVGNGIGLGLASVYGVVQHNHGTISIDSEVGCGTTFTMHFPAVAVPPPSAPESLSGPAMRVGRNQRPPTILLVEDEEGVRAVTAALLERYGCQVLTAPTPNAALAIFERHSQDIDLLLTDVVMPGMDGPLLAQRLVAARSDLPVLFISGYADTALALEDMHNSKTRFLAKPFQPISLIATVRDMLSRVTERSV